MKVYTPSDRVVPWKDKLPISWEFKPLKYSVNINNDTLPESTSGKYEFRYIDISAVTPIGKIIDPEVLTFDVAPSRARRVVRMGDTIISTVRTYLKAIAFIEDPNDDLICSTGFAVLRAKSGVWPKFLFYWARSSYFVDEICARSTGVSYPAINAIEIGNLPLPIIELNEQKKISNYLDHQLARVDAMAEEASRLTYSSVASGGLIVDYRDALITAAVTGKINLSKT